MTGISGRNGPLELVVVELVVVELVELELVVAELLLVEGDGERPDGRTRLGAQIGISGVLGVPPRCAVARVPRPATGARATVSRTWYRPATSGSSFARGEVESSISARDRDGRETIRQRYTTFPGLGAGLVPRADRVTADPGWVVTSDPAETKLVPRATVNRRDSRSTVPVVYRDARIVTRLAPLRSPLPAPIRSRWRPAVSFSAESPSERPLRRIVSRSTECCSRYWIRYGASGPGRPGIEVVSRCAA